MNRRVYENTMDERNSDRNKHSEIKELLKRIRKCDNTKNKFANILKLSKYTNYLEERDKLKIFKSIDSVFISLLLRSDNPFKLFTLRLINSLISDSTQSHIKICMPFINSIIFYYCDFLNETNYKIKIIERRKKNVQEKKKKEEEEEEEEEEEKEKKENEENEKENEEENGEEKEKCTTPHKQLNTDFAYSSETDESDVVEGYYNTDEINEIYCECLIFFLKLLPFLNEKDILENAFYSYEGNSVSFDAKMYFLKKSLKKRSPTTMKGGSSGQGGRMRLKDSNSFHDQNEKREVSNSFPDMAHRGVKGEAVERGKREYQDRDNDRERDRDQGSDREGNIWDEEQTSEDDYYSGDDSIYSNSQMEGVSLVSLLFDALNENMGIVETMRNTEFFSKGVARREVVLLDERTGRNTKKENTMFKVLKRIYDDKCLLNEKSIEMTLHVLNNLFLKVKDNKFIREYFQMLNKIIENYKENRVTTMKCLINLNVYLKQENIMNVLDEKSAYKFYANIIYLFSELKMEDEKKVLYTLYSTVYSCHNFIFLNDKCSDILKTPLSYMNVELYMFFEYVMKYANNDQMKNHFFTNKHCEHIIQLICTNIEYIVNFISQNYFFFNEDHELPISAASTSHTNQGGGNLEPKSCISPKVTENGKKLSNKMNLSMREIHTVMRKIKKSIELLVEFFKDIKSHFKELNPNCNKFKIIKAKFYEEINTLIHLFCNYLIYENVHYMDDFLNLLELFSICIDEEKNFYSFLLIIKHLDVNRYYHNKHFMTKLFAYILNESMKNIVHIKILYDIFNICTFNVIECLQIGENCHFVKFPSENVKSSLARDYDFIQAFSISIDKLNGIPFVYTICEDEYNKRRDDKLFIENINNILFFSINFFFNYYFNVLNRTNEQIVIQNSHVFKHNYFNTCNGRIKTQEREFFLALNVLLTISSILFLRFDCFVLESVFLEKHPILFVQEEGTDKMRKRKKYFLRILELVYFVMYYHPNFVSLLIFRLKEIKEEEVQKVIFFETTKMKMQEKHISICTFLNRFIENHV
ncbi:hypothetical protein, conserved [Plasmodium gonderi]|uniref:Uncharacterized protein n=1 Tax=Plasmodium gonderi TaxID=77519 RepID=A0A1Y1JNA2_PLAGO|nr:hypothetical protein, conserved [Plasmodium gonderi]GAW82292.1 hypothetical protein, conserved [Plasmodium gonderi]